MFGRRFLQACSWLPECKSSLDVCTLFLCLNQCNPGLQRIQLIGREDGVPTVKNPRFREPTTLSGPLWITFSSPTYVWTVFWPFWEHFFGISLAKGCPIVPGTVFLSLFQIPSSESVCQKPSASKSSCPIHSLSLLSIRSHHHHLILLTTLSASSIAPSQCSTGHLPPHSPILLVRNLICHRTTLLQRTQTYRNGRSTKWPTGLRL